MSVRDPLTADAVQAHLAEREGWAGDTTQIQKTFQVDYDAAIHIVTEIGKAAIELEHRPDIDIRWASLHISMTTHTASDVVTELDFLLADRIDAIATAHGEATFKE
jgi:4a-hydroxytetrahydrobiopterin dehydratase